MAWPSYAQFILSSAGEEIMPSVERTEMERGIPKQRVINSDLMVEISGTVVLHSTADIAAFQTWYADTIKQVGFFEFRHPRTGALVQARFKGGAIGRFTPLRRNFSKAVCDVTLEYLR